VEGCADISFQMNKLTLSHKFYVVKGMNRNFILGRDWLRQNGVRLYFDLGCMRIGKTYIYLEEDIHIASILRVAKDTVLNPRTMTICNVKINKGFRVPDSKLLAITCVSNENKDSTEDPSDDHKQHKQSLQTKKRKCSWKS